MSVKILGTGSFLPEKSVSNDDLSKVMDTSDEWISSRTGIRSRHISIEDTTSTMAVKAAEKALEDAGISAEELDHIFVATLSGDVLTCEERHLNNLLVKDDSPMQQVAMDGQEVFKFAARMVPKSINKVLDEAGVSKEEIKYFVLHQANKRIIEAAARRLKQPIEKFPMNIDRCANTSSATIPILLDEINQKGMLNRGDKIVLSGFGGGLTWGSVYLTW